MVDDSASARALLGVRLREKGHEVEEVAHAADAAEMALSKPPDAVVTDLWMPGISGLQLCRLLRAEPATATVPVVLLTASDDRRSRFWARHAGATAYVTKTEIDRLTDVLGDLTSSPKTRPPPVAASAGRDARQRPGAPLAAARRLALRVDHRRRGPRALAEGRGARAALRGARARSPRDVAGYRWLALTTDSAPAPHVKYTTRLFIHTHPDLKEVAEREARDALDVAPPPERRKPDEGDAFVIADKRAVEAEWSTPPILLPVRFGTVPMGQIALAPSRRGASHDDRRLIAMMANELGGPLRMAALVAEARRLASTDTLTGLLNRRAFVERIEKARAASDKQLFPISMLLLDVDHFKKVNDTLGHDAGDAVLQGVARVLSAMARKSDFVARWGGEEFVVVPHVDGRGRRAHRRRARPSRHRRREVRAPERHRASRDGLGRPRERGERRVGHPRSARPRRQGDVRREASRAKSRGDCMIDDALWRFSGSGAPALTMIAFAIATRGRRVPSRRRRAGRGDCARTGCARQTAPAPAPAAAATTEPPAATSKRTAWPWVIMGARRRARSSPSTVLEVHAVEGGRPARRRRDEALLAPAGRSVAAALQSPQRQHDNAAKSSRTAALVVGTVGFLAVAGAVVLWFVEGSSSSSAPRTRRRRAGEGEALAPARRSARATPARASARRSESYAVDAATRSARRSRSRPSRRRS